MKNSTQVNHSTLSVLLKRTCLFFKLPIYAMLCVRECVFFQHEICTYIRRFFHVVKVDHSIFKGKSFIASNATAETVHKICGRSACFHTYFTFVHFALRFFSPLLFLMKSTIQSLANTSYNRKSYFSTIIDKGSSIFCLFTFSRMHERKMCCNTCSIFA